MDKRLKPFSIIEEIKIKLSFYHRNISKQISYNSHNPVPDIFLVMSSTDGSLKDKSLKETIDNGVYICTGWPKPIIMANFNKSEKRSRKSKWRIVVVSRSMLK